MLPLAPDVAVIVWVLIPIVMLRHADHEETAPCSSLAWALTQKVPVDDQLWLRVEAPQLDVWPSPQLYWYVILSPSGSEAEVLKS